jgi:hypothetical protein
LFFGIRGDWEFFLYKFNGLEVSQDLGDRANYLVAACGRLSSPDSKVRGKNNWLDTKDEFI